MLRPRASVVLVKSGAGTENVSTWPINFGKRSRSAHGMWQGPWLDKADGLHYFHSLHLHPGSRDDMAGIWFRCHWDCLMVDKPCIGIEQRRGGENFYGATSIGLSGLRDAMVRTASSHDR